MPIRSASAPASISAAAWRLVTTFPAMMSRPGSSSCSHAIMFAWYVLSPAGSCEVAYTCWALPHTCGRSLSTKHWDFARSLLITIPGFACASFIAASGSKIKHVDIYLGWSPG